MAYHLFESFKLHHDLDYRKQDCARYAFFFISIVLFTAIQFFPSEISTQRYEVCNY